MGKVLWWDGEWGRCCGGRVSGGGCCGGRVSGGGCCDGMVSGGGEGVVVGW